MVHIFRNRFFWSELTGSEQNLKTVRKNNERSQNKEGMDTE